MAGKAVFCWLSKVFDMQIAFAKVDIFFKKKKILKHTRAESQSKRVFQYCAFFHQPILNE